MSINIRFTAVFFICIAFASFTTVASEEEQNDQLHRLVAGLKDGARVLEKEEIGPSCGLTAMAVAEGVPELTSYIHADFNGDGLDDYAALIVANTSETSIVWEGQEFNEGELWVVVFLRNENGYESTVLEKSPTFLPNSGVGIRLRSPGDVVPWESEDVLTLQHPGIDLVYCEKSEVIFYWDGERFSEVWIAD